MKLNAVAKIFPRHVSSSIFLLSAVLFAFSASAQDTGSAPSFDSGDPHAFLESASASIETSLVGNFALVLIHNGQVVGGHFASVGRTVGPNSLFQVASLSKWITAWGVLALVEDGSIDMHAPVSNYLTRWSLPEGNFDNKDVTVYRLLSHGAGLTDGYGYGGFEDSSAVQTLEESLTLASDGSFIAEREGFEPGVRVGLQPGAQFRYSGGGYTILQLLIEEVTGLSFNNYMRERILLPLGMTGSTYVLDSDSESLLVDSYADDGSIAPHYRYTALGAASLYTSAQDMARFLKAHVQGADGEPAGRSVLRPETLIEMREPVFNVANRLAWGLAGMLMMNSDGRWRMGHAGSNRPAISTLAEVDPITGNGIVMLSSGQPGLMFRIYQEWVNWLEGK